MAESLKTLVRLLANQIEPRSSGPLSTTSAGTSTTIVSTDLIFADGDETVYDGGWVYWPTGTLAGQQRPIGTSALDVTTGTLTVATPFSTTTPTATEFEIHLRYPVKRGAGTPTVGGLTEIINDTLRRLWYEDWISVTAVSGQLRYALDITAYPWLTDTARVLDVFSPADPTSSVRHPTTQAWDIEDDAAAPTLVLADGFSTGPFFLKVARPAWTSIKIAGVWTEVTQAALNGGQAGLSAYSDETHAHADDVLALAITESMNHLGMKQPSMDKSLWEERRRYWADVAARCKFLRLPRRTRSRQGMRVAYAGGGLMGRGRTGRWWW